MAVHESMFPLKMSLCETFFPTDSQLGMAIFKLVDYVTTLMKFNPDIMATYPEAQEVAEKGLTPRQIRYFFGSYNELKEEKKPKYAFLDAVRNVFIAKEAVDPKLFQRPQGWLKKQNLQKHLRKLEDRHVIRQKERRYMLAGGSYFDHFQPYYFKKAMRKIPASWMTSCSKGTFTTLVYRYPRSKLVKTGPLKRDGRSTQVAFESELFERCKKFTEEIRELHASYIRKIDPPITEEERKLMEATIPIIIIDTTKMVL